jgi:hypothetical protein
VCDQETSKTRRLNPATGLRKIQPQWVVTPGKQTNKQTNKQTRLASKEIFSPSNKIIQEVGRAKDLSAPL